jgi:predicted P-loop ATPase
MAIEVLIHIRNAEPILAEIDELPKLSDTLLKVNNPRLRDGKDLHFLAANVVTVYWPVSEVSFIEVLQSQEEDQVIGFVRE